MPHQGLSLQGTIAIQMVIQMMIFVPMEEEIPPCLQPGVLRLPTEAQVAAAQVVGEEEDSVDLIVTRMDRAAMATVLTQAPRAVRGTSCQM